MNKKEPDKTIIFITIGIFLCGLFAMASASTVGSDTRFLNHLLLGILPGILIGIIAYKTPLPIIQKYAPYLFIANIVVLALMVTVPFLAETARGSTRWFVVGPVSFQPSEFLKLSFILYTASWLSVKAKSKTKKRKKSSSNIKETLIPFGFTCTIVAILLLKQPHLSTLAIILSTGFIIYFIARTPFWHTIVIVSSGLVGLAVLIRIAPYRLQRILTMLDPTSDILGSDHHAWQSAIAVGSGGLFGKGVGMSLQKYGFVPFPASDSIFAIYAEEFGFVGGVLLIALFFFFCWRCFVIAKNNTNDFARLAVFGVCSWIFIQMVVNISSTIGGPVTGVPLPFISHGKSHLFAEMAALGFILNASRYVKNKS